MDSASAMVTTPSPPIWMSSKITACPKGDQKVAVSCKISPVTQVAEVAVNRAVSSPALRPLAVAKGRQSSSVPARMMAPNPAMMTCAGVMWPRFHRAMRRSLLVVGDFIVT